MNTTLLFFALLVPISGFIAWAGDKIGHRIGKRRQSLLGLRPRHTATLITILSGVGIAAASFCMMFFSSSSFREVIARGTVLRYENAVLQLNNTQLTRSIKSAGERVRLLQQDADSAEKERQTAEVARREALARRREAETKYQVAEKSLLVAQRNLTLDKEQLQHTQGSLGTAEKQVHEARRALEDARHRRELAQIAMGNVEARLRTATADVAGARMKVGKATEEFNLVVQEQKRRLDTQKQELERLTGQIGEQTTLLASVERQFEGEKSKVAQQRGEVVRLTEEAAALEQRRMDLEQRRQDAQLALDEVLKATVALRSGRITYRVGEEVFRISIPPGGNEWKTHNVLEGLLTMASRQAERRGARTASDGIRAVWIPVQRAEDEDGHLMLVNEFTALHVAAKNIVNEKEQVVVVVTALGNAVVGEPVPVNLRTWRNPLILSAGASLGEITLDGTHAGSEIADTLYGFLRGTIRKKLLDSGTIPIGDSASDSVGEASVESVLKALDAVRATKSKARVTVRVAKDLHAADPVALEFDVRSVDAPLIGIDGLR